MTQELQTSQSSAVAQWMEPKVMVARLNRMKEIMRTVMKENIHYGIIPGCKQKSLYQPGSQVIAVAFMIGHEPESVEEYRDDHEVRYRVKTRVFDQKTSMTIAYGIGECSSSEEKYAWRKPKGKEFENTPDDRRRIKYLDDGELQQVRTNPADVANTILKMATKRSEIKGTINATAASEIFTQDIEDLPEGMDLGGGAAPRSTKPTVNPDDVKPRGAPSLATVESVSKKTGVGKDKKGVMYFVEIGGVKYSTFNVTLGEQAESLKGQPVEFTFSVNGNYKNLETVTRHLPIKAQEQCPESISRHQGDILEVESAEAFASTLVMFAAQKDITQAKLADIMAEKFGCTIDTVPAEMQKTALDHIMGL